MKPIQVKVYHKAGVELPKYETPGSSAMDVRAHLPEDHSVRLIKGQTVVIPTGLYFEIPQGYEFQVRPRSGLAAKNDLTVLNSPGTIDSDYRGELKIILHNAGSDWSNWFYVKNGDRIAQIVLQKVPQAQWVHVESLEMLQDTSRGAGGFGHTGIRE